MQEWILLELDLKDIIDNLEAKLCQNKSSI